MKKSKYIQLVLITAALASCNRQRNDWGKDSHTHVRADSTAPYTRAHHGGGIGTALLWYYAFRPFGNYNNGGYQRAGYYSNAISPRSNTGSNGFKNSVSRGGFGRGAYSVSS